MNVTKEVPDSVPWNNEGSRADRLSGTLEHLNHLSIQGCQLLEVPLVPGEGFGRLLQWERLETTDSKDGSLPAGIRVSPVRQESRCEIVAGHIVKPLFLKRDVECVEMREFDVLVGVPASEAL